MGRKRAPGGGGSGGGLGRSLIREHRLQSRGQRRDTWLHTKELDDGYDWGRLNVRSITEQSSLEEFLATAELAGTEFVAEKLNIKFVPPEARTGLLSPEESQRLQQLHSENRRALRIPRRPQWDEGTSAESLHQAERDNFLEWRRQLVRLEEEQGLILTPFERNLDFWRQLWRVIERSDVVVQIVDARNPLLFRCEDLESYVKEVSKEKENVILINKADLLTEEQRGAWARFFEQENVKVIFWSALAEGVRLTAESKEQEAESAEEAEEWEDEDEAGQGGDLNPEALGSGQQLPRRDENAWDRMSEEGDSEYEDCLEEEDDWQTCSEDDGSQEEEPPSQRSQENGMRGSLEMGPQPPQGQGAQVQNDSHLVEKQELLDLFRAMHSGKKVKEGQLTVGLVGYPNVGKSSTINTILGNKKVSVSATPGHTKHFQNIPRHVLEATYGIHIIRPREDEDPNRPPTSEELLTAYGSMRGFMTAHGQPDQPRAARYILKDYVRGKLLYCHPPPGTDPRDFQPQHESLRKKKWKPEAGAEVQQPEGSRHGPKQIENIVDRAFFHQENVRALTRGVQVVMGRQPGSAQGPSTTTGPDRGSGKPWKKHGNRNKKEKIRRLTKHLDA